MVAFARDRSPFYRELYRNLPNEIADPALLPVTNKKQLMARFNDWTTDRDVTLEKVHSFIKNPDLVGAKFIDQYTVATTSGTTGTPGIFLLDRWGMSVTATLSLRLMSDWLGAKDFTKIIHGGLRTAMVVATGGHYAGIVMGSRLEKKRGGRVKVLAAQMPLSEMVKKLNDFQPAVLAPYATVGALLATEQEAGRLKINPGLVVLSAEGLPLPEYDRIAKAFNCKVRHSYAATECTFISYSCEQKWLHINSDWLLLEAVDAENRPVPPGTKSHTVLISNLANRVQPILRYDLGDSVLVKPDPCACGNPLPAIRVQGRTTDALSFPGQSGEKIRIPALAFEIDHIAGVELFQLVQTTPTDLRVRLRLMPDVDANKVWQSVQIQVTNLLSQHKLDHVRVERTDEPPEQTESGKYRMVIPLS